jgi:hypothetical protein
MSKELGFRATGGGEAKMTTELRCSFCNKRQQEVRRVISRGSGPEAGGFSNLGVRICDECVALCMAILREEGIDLCAER